MRLSISYLYRIKIGDLYLLVKSERIPNQYQPVGGVIKRLPEGSAYLSEINAKDDDLIPIDETAKDDLRIRIDGRYLFSFMRWYDSATGRETDCWREFYEELVKPRILSQKNFGSVLTRHIRRYVTPVHFTNFTQSHELLVAEIYELVPTEAQKNELMELQKKSLSNILWATEEVILRQGVIQKQLLKANISVTALWTL